MLPLIVIFVSHRQLPTIWSSFLHSIASRTVAFSTLHISFDGAHSFAHEGKIRGEDEGEGDGEGLGLIGIEYGMDGIKANTQTRRCRAEEKCALDILCSVVSFGLVLSVWCFIMTSAPAVGISARGMGLEPWFSIRA